MPPKFVAEAESKVKEPKQHIMMGRTREGPNRLPSMATGGANRTYGTKKIDSSRLYCPFLKCRSVSIWSVLALPRLPLSRALKRSGQD